jgi:hypothetical protein
MEYFELFFNLLRAQESDILDGALHILRTGREDETRYYGYESQSCEFESHPCSSDIITSIHLASRATR